MFCTKPKLSAILEKQVQESIENKDFTAKRHPGILKHGVVHVPQYVQKAIQVVLRDKPVKAILEEGKSLARYLHGRHPPPEEHEVKAKKAQLEEMVELEMGVDLSSLGVEEREVVQKRKQHLVMKKLRQHIHRWRPVPYDTRHKVLVYLLCRAAADHAAVSKVLAEVKHRQPLFSPATVFDFGSGVGTTTWAVRELWQDAPKEYFCVDSSVEMNDLASLLLRDGQETKEMPFKGVFYRQFLPASSVRQYDLVVSAFSLLELPSSQSRLQTILSLWKKTQKFLVLVEQGTNAGFKVINEARDFLISTSNRENTSTGPAHVFSPCPHDLECPRFLDSRIPCNFEVSYETLPFGQRPKILQERYSYVVMSKGQRPSEDPQWPRLVSPTLVRHKHSICRMCTANGELREIIFTASKHGRIPYRCARASKWGDLLPVQIKPPENPAQSDEEELARETDQPS
ncbi:methyltransferase-like protein 17, mitochondrial isoform X2 [Bacillus rossius redtenbacheri]|uniref:methyltransferase-like protein 17, mitochondrial isoform X2 n=1 Tax=Bacillus rossius redtenbacheri TaxID=93214 RepID=UPI002FDECFA9